jgi:uncharacterized PurR-regulated membrane protein YhhQ (DUF165 family)
MTTAATTRLAVVAWLAAITAANLISAHYGPEASIYNAFALIGLTFVLRDYLHDAWQEHRVPKIAALIISGSVLAYLVSPAAGRIGLASGIAFAASESVDAVAYHAVRRLPWLKRSNVSNFAGALVDSVVFPTVAFGGFVLATTVGQLTAKVAGALLFTLLLARRRRPRAVPALADH